MNVSDVITRARRILKDDFAPYRFSDAYMLAAYSDAQRELGRLRPDLLATSSFTVTTLSDVVSTSTASAFDETMREALSYLTCEKVYLTESADDGNLSMASFMRKKFEEAMIK